MDDSGCYSKLVRKLNGQIAKQKLVPENNWNPIALETVEKCLFAFRKHAFYIKKETQSLLGTFEI